jgi:type II secretory pathway pseudopilin PulG
MPNSRPSFCPLARRGTLRHAPSRPRTPPFALTTTEMLVSVVIVSILASLATVMVSRAQRTRGATVCASNLRSIGLAFQSYAIDSQGRLPSTLGTNSQWEDLLRKFTHRSTFQCPSDNELYPSLGSSYDWRDTGDPLTTLAGKSLTEPLRTNIALSFEALPGWHDPCKVQVVFLDGTVRMKGQDALLLDLTSPIRSQP